MKTADRRVRNTVSFPLGLVRCGIYGALMKLNVK